MSSSYISKISLYLSFLFIFSCQDTILSLNKKDIPALEVVNHKFEKTETIDLSYFEFYENNKIDFYSNQLSNYDFLNKDHNKLKINNYENKYDFKTPINVIYYEKNIYSINSKGELVKFDINTGKLIERISIGLDKQIKDPVSFSLYNNNFVVAYKSGDIFMINKIGEVVWQFQNKDILNTPIKIYEDHLIILYSDEIIFLNAESGDVVFEKNYKSNNIIQSSGGKIDNYFNIFFFLLSNSEFNALDTYLFEEYKFDFDNIELNTSLNNLKDQIHVYKNFLVYLDDGKNIYTYDINNNSFILKDYSLNKSSSVILFNNALVTKNDSFLYFYNLKNGNLFAKINIENILNKKSLLIKALINNNKLHLFTNSGDIIIFDENLNIENNLNLKIKDIIEVYSYQNKIFINTQKGFTYIY